MKQILLILTLSFLGIVTLKSQSIEIPLNNQYINYFESKLYEIDSTHHTSIKPYSSKSIRNLATETFAKLHFDSKFTNTRFGGFLLNKHLVQLQHEDYSIIVDPLLHYGMGSANNVEKSTYYRTKGFRINGHIGKSMYYTTDLYENQARFPQYVEDFIDDNSVVPGQGLAKDFRGDRDFNYASGSIIYDASKFFQFQAGHGKNFIGDGYRSLLLSDNGFNYPFFKIKTSFWNIQYMNLFTKMLRVNNTTNIYPEKYSASHYLSWNVTKKLSVGFFESIIYEDSLNTRGFDVNYLNPLIFYRSVEFAVGSRGGNALMGLNVKYKLTDLLSLYGQFILDEFAADRNFGGQNSWANKFGYQLGFKSFNTFYIPNLTVQSEINWVRPYTYSHKNALQNYAHYNQALAHPLGANFFESVTHVRYNYKRLFFETELMYASIGQDSLGSNWGTDIFLSYDTREQEFDNLVGQGINTKILYADLKIGYLVNPSYNLRFEVGYSYRKYKPEIETADVKASTTHYFQIGLYSALQNHYYDF